ncbi:hypothetical protein OEZ86_011397 [Tetradesmus obliquus]|nr:hypothetical protein OEZ86_011397 [Tetradesmus obliquus]
MVDSNRLEKARTDKQEGLAIIQEVTSQHSREMLKAKPWRCIICQKRATRLYLQAMLYVNEDEKFVRDLGPLPCCYSQACNAAVIAFAQKMREAAAAAERS